LIFFSLLAGLFFIYLARFARKRKSVILAVLIVSLVAGTGFYGYMFDHWNVSSGSMTELTYDTGIYVRYEANNTFISNDGLLAARVGAISERPCLPIGGGTLHGNGPEQLIYDFLHEDDFQIIPIPPSSVSVGSDALYNAKGEGNVEQDWATIHGTHCDELSQNRINQYKLQYSLTTKRWGDGFWAYNKNYHSRFLASMRYERYKVYDNGVNELYYYEDV
jgi:hypothetical protein